MATQHKSAALPLALAYAALIVYASLYPFADWRDQGIAPWAYLRDVLQRLPTQRSSQIDDLLPHRWQPASDAAP